MAVLRIVRFTTDPGHSEAMVARRAELIAATRQRFDGLTATRLARVDERTWIDHWRWESAAQMQAAIDNVTTIPGAAEAFALIGDPRPEVAEIVDEHGEWER
jgi:hypothetical protein